MNEQELLQQALESVQRLRVLVTHAYVEHDHNSDLIGGALLSSIRLFVKATEEALYAILLHLSSKGSE